MIGGGASTTSDDLRIVASDWTVGAGDIPVGWYVKMHNDGSSVEFFTVKAICTEPTEVYIQTDGAAARHVRSIH